MDVTDGGGLGEELTEISNNKPTIAKGSKMVGLNILKLE